MQDNLLTSIMRNRGPVAAIEHALRYGWTPSRRLSQVKAFFVSYNKQRGKKFKITGTGGPKAAVKFLKAGIRSYKTALRKR